MSLPKKATPEELGVLRTAIKHVGLETYMSERLREEYKDYCQEITHEGGRPRSFEAWAGPRLNPEAATSVKRALSDKPEPEAAAAVLAALGAPKKPKTAALEDLYSETAAEIPYCTVEKLKEQYGHLNPGMQKMRLLVALRKAKAVTNAPSSRYMGSAGGSK